MGGGIGFVRDALNNANRNRENLKNKPNFKQTYKVKSPNRKISYKKSNPKELEEFRSAFLAKQKKRKVKDAILFMSITLFLLFLIWKLFA